MPCSFNTCEGIHIMRLCATPIGVVGKSVRNRIYRYGTANGFRFKWFCEYVRLAGKRKRGNESAAVVFADCQLVAGGIAPGIEAVMAGGLWFLNPPWPP